MDSKLKTFSLIFFHTVLTLIFYSSLMNLKSVVVYVASLVFSLMFSEGLLGVSHSSLHSQASYNIT